MKGKGKITERTFLRSEIYDEMKVIKNVDAKWHNHATEGSFKRFISKRMDKENEKYLGETGKTKHGAFTYYFVNSRTLR